MKKNFTSVLTIAVSLFSAVAVNTFLHPCAGMMRMHCKTTTDTATVIFLLSFITGVVSLFLKSERSRKTAGIVSGILGIILVFVPFMGSCAMETMRCNTHTMPAIRIGGFALFLISVASAVLMFRKRSELV